MDIPEPSLGRVFREKFRSVYVVKGVFEVLFLNRPKNLKEATTSCIPSVVLFTGGILNYTATIAVDREVLVMRVQMNGVKTDGTPADMIVTLSGNLPIREGVGFNYEDHTADYTKVRPGEKQGSISNETKIFCVPNVCKVKFL